MKISCFVLAVLAFFCIGSVAIAEEKPNIVYILVDN